ncbi:hypothetical protein, variant [Capsaspora owczarzaki ATCC 30864]|uniref:Uncharacterized protein n=1 Tax=Capsaspora owczarzaki (strain ATCC 30864) TaxID=595528 RepID=A0A0D2WX87_CAPO3|nr:hypothetical protein, variant [Capsaspora owczarzaki ATCC 30864]
MMIITTLLQFCQPCGWTTHTEYAEPAFNVAVLSEADGLCYYVASLTFWEQVATLPAATTAANNSGSTTDLPLRRAPSPSPSLITRSTSSLTSSSTRPNNTASDAVSQSNSASTNASVAESIYVPKAICLISRHPFFDAFRQSLCHIFLSAQQLTSISPASVFSVSQDTLGHAEAATTFANRQGGINAEILAHMAARIVNDIPLPPVGGAKVAVQFGGKTSLQPTPATPSAAPSPRQPRDGDQNSSSAAARDGGVVSSSASSAAASTIFLQRNPPRLLPDCPVSVASVFRALDVNNTLLVLSAILTEQKVAFISSSHAQLTKVSMGLLALMYPLVYRYVYIPVLPRQLLEVLSAPTPVILGLHTSFLLDAEISGELDIASLDDMVQVDVDNNRVYIPPSIKVPDPPYRATARLLTRLREILYPDVVFSDDAFTGTRHQHVQAATRAATETTVTRCFASGASCSPASKAALTKQLDTAAIVELEIRLAFCRFFVSILHRYREFLAVVRVHPTPRVVFNGPAFVRSVAMDGSGLSSMPQNGGASAAKSGGLAQSDQDGAGRDTDSHPDTDVAAALAEAAQSTRNRSQTFSSSGSAVSIARKLVQLGSAPASDSTSASSDWDRRSLNSHAAFHHVHRSTEETASMRASLTTTRGYHGFASSSLAAPFVEALVSGNCFSYFIEVYGAPNRDRTFFDDFVDQYNLDSRVRITAADCLARDMMSYPLDPVFVHIPRMAELLADVADSIAATAVLSAPLPGAEHAAKPIPQLTTTLVEASPLASLAPAVLQRLLVVADGASAQPFQSGMSSRCSCDFSQCEQEGSALHYGSAQQRLVAACRTTLFALSAISGRSHIPFVADTDTESSTVLHGSASAPDPSSPMSPTLKISHAQALQSESSLDGALESTDAFAQPVPSSSTLMHRTTLLRSVSMGSPPKAQSGLVRRRSALRLLDVLSSRTRDPRARHGGTLQDQRELLSRFFDLLFSEQIPAACEILAPIKRILKDESARIHFCHILRLKERAAAANLASGGKTALSREQFAVLASLANVMLADEYINETTTATLLATLSQHFFRMTGGMQEFLWHKIASHEVWRNDAFWKNSFFEQMEERLALVYSSNNSAAKDPAATTRPASTTSNLPIFSSLAPAAFIDIDTLVVRRTAEWDALDSQARDATFQMEEDLVFEQLQQHATSMVSLMGNLQEVAQLTESIAQECNLAPDRIDQLMMLVEQLATHHELIRQQLKEEYAKTPDIDSIRLSTASVPLLEGEMLFFQAPKCLLLTTAKENGLEPAEGTLFVTNYRLIFRGFTCKHSVAAATADLKQLMLTRSVPLSSIFKITKTSLMFDSEHERWVPEGLEIYSKSIQVMRLCFDDNGPNSSHSITSMMYKMIKNRATPTLANELFAICSGRQSDPTSKNWTAHVISDFTRIDPNIGLTTASPFRLTSENRHFQLSSTLGPVLAVPRTLTDLELGAVAEFHVDRRLPTVSWVHPTHRSIALLRSGMTKNRRGIAGKRCVEDEKYIKAIVAAASPAVQSVRHATTVTAPAGGDAKKPTDDSYPALYILTERAQSRSLVPSRSQDADSEFDVPFYPRVEFLYLDHLGSKGPLQPKDAQLALERLVHVCCRAPDDQLLSQIEETGWLGLVSSVLDAASLTVSLMETLRASVLISLEKGTAQTAIIVSLVQIMFDPYYRTMEGFFTLIQKEWLDAGHPFALHGGHTTASSDSARAPYFSLFIDAVWQITRQFPTSFEFNEVWLAHIGFHEHALRFGTFLLNSKKERDEPGSTGECLFARLAAAHRESAVFFNFLYAPPASCEGVAPSLQSSSSSSSFDSFALRSTADCIRPSSDVAALAVWAYQYLTAETERFEFRPGHDEQGPFGSMVALLKKMTAVDVFGVSEPALSENQPDDGWRGVWRELESAKWHQQQEDPLQEFVGSRPALECVTVYGRQPAHPLLKGRLPEHLEPLYVLPHRFGLYTYRAPTMCDHCGTVLWGLVRQGFKCNDCGYNTHERCLSQVLSTCSSFKRATATVINTALGSAPALQQPVATLAAIANSPVELLQRKLAAVTTAPAPTPSKCRRTPAPPGPISTISDLLKASGSLNPLGLLLGSRQASKPQVDVALVETKPSRASGSSTGYDEDGDEGSAAASALSWIEVSAVDGSTEDVKPTAPLTGRSHLNSIGGKAGSGLPRLGSVSIGGVAVATADGPRRAAQQTALEVLGSLDEQQAAGEGGTPSKVPSTPTAPRSVTRDGFVPEMRKASASISVQRQSLAPDTDSLLDEVAVVAPQGPAAATGVVDITMEGELWKMGGAIHSWQCRHFILDAGSYRLLYYEALKTGTKKFKGEVDFRKVSRVTELTTSPGGIGAKGREANGSYFEIATDERTFYFLAPSPESRSQWMRQLNSLLVHMRQAGVNKL